MRKRKQVFGFGFLFVFRKKENLGRTARGVPSDRWGCLRRSGERVWGGTVPCLVLVTPGP